MSNFKYITLAFLLFTIRVAAQDSLAREQTIVPLLSSTAVFVDYGKAFGQLLNTESKHEFGAQIEFKNKWFVVGEFGLATLNPDGGYQNTNYEAKGNYYRAGLGYKVDMTAKSNIYLSIRYARASFSDSGIIDISSGSGIYDDISESFERTGLSAQWYEAVLSSESRLFKGLYAGFHLRFRAMYKYDEQAPIDVYTIPGYGRSFDDTIPALNLYLKYAFERF